MRADAERDPGSQDVAPPGYPPDFGTGEREQGALLTLSTLRGITPRKLHALAWRVGSAVGCVAAIRSGSAGSQADRRFLGAAEPARIQAQLNACSGRILGPHDPGYPSAFADLLYDPPAWLYVRGAQLPDQPDRVAVVGARRCSALGREIAHDIGRRLGGIGVHVVSGGAFGIDAAAHRGALAGGGVTIGVLGSGVDVLYPRSSADLLLQIAERGALISEYPPGQGAEPHHFPARNRLVVALSRAVVVVEGAARSGSRISVDHALDLGRDVFAVPGPVTSPLSETPHEIIRDGATLIREPTISSPIWAMNKRERTTPSLPPVSPTRNSASGVPWPPRRCPTEWRAQRMSPSQRRLPSSSGWSFAGSFEVWEDATSERSRACLVGSRLEPASTGC